MIMFNRGLDMIGHSGSDPGYTSLLAIDPKTDDAVILLRNYNTGETNLEVIARDLLERL
jgi:hypothetical protein